MSLNSSISMRANENLRREVNWTALRKTLAVPYRKESQPDGIINMGLAESSLIHPELIQYIKSNFEISSVEHMTYGQGPSGSPRLIKALVGFMNDRFNPICPVTEDQVMISAGVAAAIDCLTWGICNDGEGILVSKPLYAGFCSDIELRSRGKLLPVSYCKQDQEYNVLDLFDAQKNRESLDSALKMYQKDGIQVRAVLISNPHNPLGRCYSVEALQEIGSFCHQNGLHLISDEIYAQSTFQNPAFPEANPFRSALSVEFKDFSSSTHLHVLYGMSKDFGANGMRLGAIHTSNVDLLEAMITINQFSWPAYAVQDIWARILSDKAFLDQLLQTNQERLAACYFRFTSFLDKFGIPYLKGGNSGFFIWAHLVREPATRAPEAAQKPVKVLKEHLLENCQKNGLFIRDGVHYLAEDKTDGWFRITFTVEEDVLRVATDRLIRSLKQTGLL